MISYVMPSNSVPKVSEAEEGEYRDIAQEGKS